MADPIGGISTSITLDITDALKKFKELKDEINKPDTLSGNVYLDSFLRRMSTGTKDATAQVEKLRKQLDAMNKSLGSATAGGGMNMAAIARAAKQAGGMDVSALAASTQVEKLRRQLDAMGKSHGLVTAGGGMNMAALAKAAKQAGGMDVSALAAYSGTSYRQIPDLQKAMARSARYTQIGEQGDVAKQQRYELGFQNRYLEREIGTGDMRKRIVETVKAEREAKKLAATHDRLIRQTKLMEAQVKYGRYGGAAAYFYGQNREAISGAGRMAGGVAMGAAGTVAGLAASGYSGTVEGERFALEMRRLSLELAAAFKPFMDGLTNATRSIRKFIQAGGEERQNQIMRGGGAIAGGAIGAKIGSVFGPYGTAIGGGLGAIAGYNAPDMLDTERYRYQDIMQGGASEEMMKRNQSMRGMSAEQRQAYIEKNIAASAKMITESKAKVEAASPEDRERLSKQYYAEAMQLKENINAMKKINKEESGFGSSAAAGLGAGSGAKAASESRKLMLTEGVGFAEAGSTYYDLAETLIRTQAAEANKPIVDKLDELKQEVGKLNK